MIGSIAWPAAFAFAIFLFRHQLTDLLGGLRRLRWREVEAEFGAGLVQAREVASAQLTDPDIKAEAEPTSSLLVDGSTVPADRVLALAKLSPRLLVMESWRLVEQAARELDARWAGANGKRPGHGPPALERLVDEGVLPELDYDQYTILRQLRNQAAHESRFELTPDAALEYAALARQLSARLERNHRDDA